MNYTDYLKAKRDLLQSLVNTFSDLNLTREQMINILKAELEDAKQKLEGLK